MKINQIINEGLVFYAKNPDGTKTYSLVKDAEHLANLEQKYRGAQVQKLDFARQDVQDWLDSRGVNLRRFPPGMETTVGPNQGVAEGDLNEFAPAGRDPGGDDEEPGDDPYKYPKPKAYDRSIDFFGRFEADHFDDEEFDKATGVFKGYWDDEEGRVQIGYFKFDDPARTGSDDPGMGWYYEPQNESVAEGDTQLQPGMQVKDGTIVKVDGNTVTVKTSNGDLMNMNIHDVDVAQNMAEGMGGGEYGRVLDALKLYYPRVSMEELNVPGYHKVIANKANVPVEYAAQVINDFAKPYDDEYDNKPDVSEGKPREKEADYGADYQDMVSRVKKLAGLGPLKTVYDPQKRVYKNVPTAVQPKKEQQ